MRKQLCAGLCLQLIAMPTLSQAASLGDDGRHAVSRVGAFAGARLRIDLGRQSDDRGRIGIAIAPLRASARTDGTRTLRIGEGLDLSFDVARTPRLSIAGRPLDRRFGASEGKKGGVPTWVLITGGVVVVLGIGAALFIDRLEDASD